MQIVFILISGILTGFLIGYFTYKIYFKPKVIIHANLIKKDFGKEPIFHAKGDVEVIIISDIIEINTEQK